MMPQGHSNSEYAVTNLITKTKDFFHSAVRAVRSTQTLPPKQQIFARWQTVDGLFRLLEG
jgi:hypothetical protein